MNKYFFFILLSGLLVLTSCEEDCEIPDDPSCKNYDPCWGKPPVSASFTMGEEVESDTFEVSESVHMGRNLLLIADQDHEEYRWQIGAEPKERSGKSIIVYFGAPYENVKITLIVSDTPNTACNPGDDGRDTLSKTIQVLSYLVLPIWGTYRGIDIDRPDEPFTIIIKLDTVQSTEIGTIRNLPEGCPIARGLRIGAGGFRIPIGSGAPGCYGIGGLAILNETNDSLRIEYNHNDPTLYNQTPRVYKRITKTFIGKKQ